MFFFSNLCMPRKQIKILTYAFTILLAVFICMSDSINVCAADFKHNHTGSCYTTGTGPCTSAHSTSTRTEPSTRHCNNCGTQKSHTSYVYWDKCYGTGQEFELGGYQKCNTCGATSYSWGQTSSGTHMVSKQILSCGKDNTSTGTLWIQNEVSGWTTENVTLKAGVTIRSSSLVLASAPFSWDNRTSWTSENVMSVTDNGTYSVYARSSGGTVVGETIAVTNIDRTGPVLNDVERSESDWTNQDVLLTLTVIDLQPSGGEGCGPAQAPYSYDGGATYVDTNSLTVSGNGIYEVQLKDMLGNIGYGQIEVNNIDKSAPVISGIAQVNDGWQSQTVNMTVSAQDADGGSGLHAMPYSIDGVNWQAEAEFTLNENGKYKMHVRDAVGNETNQEFDVNKIDITAPVIESIQAIPGKIKKDKVEVVINAKDLQPDGSMGCGLAAEAYSIDGGMTWQESNIFVVEAGTVYDVRVRDALLWESSEHLLTRKDLPYPAVSDTPQNTDGNSNPSNGQSGTTPQGTKEVTEDEGDDTDGGMEEASEEVKEKAQKDASNEASKDDILTETDLSDKEKESDELIKENVIKKEVKPDENASENTKTVKVIRNPWYSTVAGKAVIISAGTIALGSLAGIIIYLFIFSAVVYCVNGAGKMHKLGRVIIHRTREGYYVFLSDLLLEAASVPRYRIRLNFILAKMMKNANLIVESNEKNVEVLMQESIDFEL